MREDGCMLYTWRREGAEWGVMLYMWGRKCGGEREMGVVWGRRGVCMLYVGEGVCGRRGLLHFASFVFVKVYFIQLFVFFCLVQLLPSSNELGHPGPGYNDNGIMGKSKLGCP